MAIYMITGSSTDTGAPIYLRREGGWTARFAEGAVLTTDAERDDLLQRARGEQRECCDPYPIDVEDGAEGPKAVSLKEQIRATGPTVPYAS